MKNKKNTIKFHNLYLLIGIVLFAFLLVRVIYVSLSPKIDGINLVSFAKERSTAKEIYSAKRGEIYDRNGNVVAQNVSSYTLIAYLDPKRSKKNSPPKHVQDKELTAKSLAPLIGMKEEDILKILNKKNLYQVEFGKYGRGLTELKKDEILALGLPGIDFIESEKRYYPYGNFLSYAIGYAKERPIKGNESKTEIVGEMGIEKYYDSSLRGVDGYRKYQKDRRGFMIPNTPVIEVKAKDGNDIYLTIDANIELFVEQAINNAKKNTRWKWLTVTVADAKTGEILAMSQDPSFDPNIKNITNYNDLNISYPFEPGSTMKTYTFMAAMEKGIYDGKKTFKSGYVKAKDGTIISDWKKEGWGNITYDQGYMLSANTSVMNLIQSGLSGEELKSYFKKFGFGQKTGIRLSNEQSGLLPFKYETEVLNASFGQALTTTPIQHIKALTMIANDGVLLQPYIIEKIYSPSKKRNLYSGEKKSLGQIVKKDTANYMKELMYQTVNSDPSLNVGHRYKIDGYDIIGKTGTAQIAEKGRYTNKYISSFNGMFPKDDPKIIIYIAANDPIKNGSSYDTLAPIFKEIVVNVASYLNVFNQKKSEEEKTVEFVMPYFLNKDTSKVKKELEQNKLKYLILGDGDKIIAQYPQKGLKVSPNNLIILKTNKPKVPDFTNLSLKESLVILNFLDLKYVINGNGYVVKQSIGPNTEIKKESVITLDLVAKVK